MEQERSGPVGAVFPAMIVFRPLNVPVLKMAPPPEEAPLRERVELLVVSMLKLAMPPPRSEVFLERGELPMASCPEFPIHPPLRPKLFPLTTHIYSHPI